MSTPANAPPNDYFATNIPRYFLFIALKGLGFGLFVATWVIYLQEQRGLSLSQAALIDATFFVAAAFGEMPTGIIADILGRKASMTIGAYLMTVGVLGWAFLPTLPLIMIAYVAMGIGLTCLSGAEDALFYESVQLTGRGQEYTRLVGRAGATFPGALAVGSVIGGLLASIELALPYIASGCVMLAMLGVILTLKEPRMPGQTERHERKSFRQVISQAVALMRSRPTLLYPMLYLALVPVVPFMIESVFLQPQAVKLGVPIAGLGVLFMFVQMTNMAGATSSDRMKGRFGETRILYAAPLLMMACLLLLAALQILPALSFVLVMCFLNAILGPILLTRIQDQVADDVRATIISMRSLMFTTGAAICQPSLGFVADEAGLPTVYIILAGALGVVLVFLWWRGRQYLPSDKMEVPTAILEAA